MNPATTNQIPPGRRDLLRPADIGPKVVDLFADFGDLIAQLFDFAAQDGQIRLHLGDGVIGRVRGGRNGRLMFDRWSRRGRR